MSRFWAPIFLVTIAVGHIQALCVCEGYGGSGGDFFSDSNASGFGNITMAEIWAGSRVDGIRFVYGSSSGVHHGGTGGTRNYFVLDAPGEHIWQVSGRSASRVDQLIFSTKDDSQNIRVYGPYGGDGGTSFTTEGTYLKYISGRANKELDRIDFFYDDDCICSEPGFRH